VHVHFHGPVFGTDKLAEMLAPDIERELKHRLLLRRG
jgi:hypothetical protein